MQHQRRRPCRIRLRRGNLAVFEHGVDHEIAALLRAVRMSDRRIDCGAFGQSREQRGFVERQLLGRLAEVKLRCCLESVHAVAQKNLIGVERENLRLGETPFDLDRQHRLLHLALPAAVGRQKKIARQLHSQSRRTLHFASRLDVAIGGADDPPEVDPRVTRRNPCLRWKPARPAAREESRHSSPPRAVAARTSRSLDCDRHKVP